MKRIAVVPPEATARVHSLLDAAGWKVARARGAGDGDGMPAGAPGLDAALEVVRLGDPVLFVPDTTEAGKLRRILVVHEGSRGDRAAMVAADEAAVASGAQIVVLHVPPSKPSTTSASLPFRIADHGTYDWAEWRDEFLRRCCKCSPGVQVTLHVSAGGLTTLRNQVRDERPDLVILSGPAKGGDVGDAHRVVLRGTVPVLLVPTVGRERAAKERAELAQRR